MKIQTTCLNCLLTGKADNVFVHAEMRDDGVYDLTCELGHQFTIMVQQLKFEMLFDMGSLALLDGYFRESVATIAASLERFFQFYVEVICRKMKLKDADIESAWKSVSMQSERQLGVFLFMYLIETKSPIKSFIYDENIKQGSETVKVSKFRNDVIHRGYIPSSEEAHIYADLVYRFMYRILKELKVSANEAIGETVRYPLGKANLAMSAGLKTTQCIPTLVSLSSGVEPPESFYEAVKVLKKSRHYCYPNSSS